MSIDTLREQCIQAVGSVLQTYQPETWWPGKESYIELVARNKRNLSELVLDGLLDVLGETESIPEYPEQTGYIDVSYTNPDGVSAAYLIKVLRTNREQA